MRRFIQKRLAFLVAVVFVTVVNVGGPAFAADPPIDVEALQAQLDEAKALLEKDKASHAETAEKKRLIDEKLATQKERETKIFDELKQLCEQQDKLQAGSLDSCLAKLSN